MTLREILESTRERTPDVLQTVDDDGSVAWSVRGVTFALLSANGLVASFLLDPVVAGAAARTPDATASSRGPGWVELQPQDLDGHAANRAAAWFRSGHRRLAGPGV